MSWALKPLGELCDVLDSKRKPITKKDRIEGEYPYYGATGILSYVEKYIFDEKLVLIGEDGAKWGAGENTAFPVEGKCWVNNHAHVIRPHRDNILDQWIIYYLNAMDLSPFITGLTVPKLNQEKMRSITLPVPPLPEQKRIVAILDEAFAGIDAAIANTEKNLASARELFESTLNTIFTQKGKGWEEKKLGDISIINYGYTAKASHEKVGPKFLRITDIQDGNVNWDTVPFCEISSSDHSKHKLIDGDLVFARTGATTGKSYLLSNPPDVVCASYLIRVRIKKGVFIPEFLRLFFQTKQYWDDIAIGISGSAQGGFNASKLGELIIPVPPLELQEKISEKSLSIFSETKSLETIYQQKLVSLNELKQSLLQKAFSGELTTDTKIAEAAE